LIKESHKVHTRLVRELEKKFSGKHVVFVAQRTILPKTFNRGKVNAGPRPRSRTLTAVHDAILEDIVFPTEIVGKRTRYAEGSKQMKVFLDAKDTHNMEAKLDTFAKVYFDLTNKEVQFAFPVENP
jgi:small subunit ribosomal protein S7e